MPTARLLFRTKVTGKDAVSKLFRGIKVKFDAKGHLLRTAFTPIPPSHKYVGLSANDWPSQDGCRSSHNTSLERHNKSLLVGAKIYRKELVD